MSVDDQVGRLLNVLEEHGLRENTLIIFTSDNGANGGEGGTSTPYTGGKGQGTQKEGWVRVPTVFSMLGVIPEGKQHDGLIANFDFYSTITSLTCQAVPDHCDGVDLVPYLSGEKTGPAHEYLFDLTDYLPTLADAAGLEDDGVPRDGVSFAPVLLGNHGQNRQRPWIYIDHRGKRCVRSHRWKLYGGGRFFDLKNDPAESSPVAKSQLTEDARQWRTQLSEALEGLTGPLAK